MKIKVTLILNALVLAIGILAALVPTTYSFVVVPLAGFFILISIGVGISRLFAKYPAHLWGTVMILGSLLLGIVGSRLLHTFCELEFRVTTVTGAIRGGRVTTTKSHNGEALESYTFDVSFTPANGSIITVPIEVSEEFGRKHAEFVGQDWLKRRITDSDPLHKYDQAYLTPDNSVQVRYIIGEPVRAVIVGAREYNLAVLAGLLCIIGSVGFSIFGVKILTLGIRHSLAGRVSYRRSHVKPQPRPVAKVVAESPLVFITRNGAQSGPYPKFQLQALVQKGELLPTDLAWHDGMTDWEPLEVMFGKS